MNLQQQARDLFGLDLTSEQVTQFSTFEHELIEWNKVMNLTAIIEPDAIRVRHFLDSLSIARANVLTAGCRIVDIGAGAGFPGLPLAIAFPNSQVTLMESTGKKVDFMRHVIDLLKLTNVEAIHARAEKAGQHEDYRAMYDVVLARAVARMPALAEYMLPLAKVGGYCIAMKGSTAHDEAVAAKRALNVLGGLLDRVETLSLPDVEHPHNLVIIKKVSATPSGYPRDPGTPTRKPIE